MDAGKACAGTPEPRSVGVGVNDRVGCWKGAKDATCMCHSLEGAPSPIRRRARRGARPLRPSDCRVRFGRRDQRPSPARRLRAAAAVIESLSQGLTISRIAAVPRDAHSDSHAPFAAWTRASAGTMSTV